MYRSKDKLINVTVAKDTTNLVFQPADWSIVNLSESFEDGQRMFDALYQTAVQKHVVLVLCRHKRRDRLKAISTISNPGKFNYLETVSLIYEKPKSCSNNGFLPLSEIGFVLYKGPTPNTNKTRWFRDDYNNATNVWDLGVQSPDEGDVTYYQRFSWELNLLLMSLAAPLSTRRFIYGLPLNADERESLFKFCNKYIISVELVSPTPTEANDIIKHYENFGGKE
ncbi:MAG: hypothetical protein QXL01_00580 [Thermoplasmatales archaeon]